MMDVNEIYEKKLKEFLRNTERYNNSLHTFALRKHLYWKGFKEFVENYEIEEPKPKRKYTKHKHKTVKEYKTFGPSYLNENIHEHSIKITIEI